MKISIVIALFFLLSQIFLLSNGSYFWLFWLLIFSYFFWRKFAIKEDEKKFSFLILPLVIIWAHFLLLRRIEINFLGEIFYTLILTTFFGAVLGLLARIDFFQRRKDWLSKSFSFLTWTALIHFILWFFYSGALSGFFWKEIILFFFVFLIFWANEKRKIAEAIENEIEKVGDFNSKVESESKLGENMIEAELINGQNIFGGVSLWLSCFVSALILLELAWVLTFLPINFFSLAMVWLAGFYLIKKFFFLLSDSGGVNNSQDELPAIQLKDGRSLFGFSINSANFQLLIHLILVALFVLIVLASAVWRIV